MRLQLSVLNGLLKESLKGPPLSLHSPTSSRLLHFFLVWEYVGSGLSDTACLLGYELGSFLYYFLVLFHSSKLHILEVGRRDGMEGKDTVISRMF